MPVTTNRTNTLAERPASQGVGALIQVSAGFRYFAVAALVLLAGCSRQAPIEPERYAASDRFHSQVLANLNVAQLELIADIDHSRMGAETGTYMPPARVLIFSSPELESALLQLDPLTGLDLPLRVLSYERSPGDSAVAWNSYAFLESRYALADRPELRDSYRAIFHSATLGIPQESLIVFEDGEMPDKGIVHIESPFDFSTTRKKVINAINSQDDTLWFGEVDYRARASDIGQILPPATLILFGAPEPGARAMSSSPILGLDVFCQKFLIWQGDDSKVRLSFNDVTALAQRHNAEISLPLRVIQFRLESVFEKALERE